MSLRPTEYTCNIRRVKTQRRSRNKYAPVFSQTRQTELYGRVLKVEHAQVPCGFPNAGIYRGKKRRAFVFARVDDDDDDNNGTIRSLGNNDNNIRTGSGHTARDSSPYAAHVESRSSFARDRISNARCAARAKISGQIVFFAPHDPGFISFPSSRSHMRIACRHVTSRSFSSRGKIRRDRGFCMLSPDRTTARIVFVYRRRDIGRERQQRHRHAFRGMYLPP